MELREIQNMIGLKVQGLGPVPSPEEMKTAIDAVQRMYIQPVAKIRATADYTTTKGSDSVDLSLIADDIYKINFIQDVTSEPVGVDILVEDDTLGYGIRLSGDTVHFQRVSAGKTFRFFYEKRLRNLGPNENETRVPDIGEDWHDLYWLGVVALLDPNPVKEARFREKLDEFRYESARRSRHVRVGGW